MTEKKISDKIRKSLEGDKIKWSLKIEQNIVNIKPAILLSLIKTQSNLSNRLNFLLRVWSWLRTNAGGVPNTCKSSEWSSFGNGFSGGRVSNTWATCLIEGNSLPKGRLIPHKIVVPHGTAIKGAIRYEMGPRRIS